MDQQFYRWCNLWWTITGAKLKMTWWKFSEVSLNLVFGKVINHPVCFGDKHLITVKVKTETGTADATLTVKEVMWVVGRKYLIPLGIRSEIKTGIVTGDNVYLVVPYGKNPTMVVQQHRDTIQRLSDLADDLNHWVSARNKRNKKKCS